MGKHTATAFTLMVLLGLGISACANGERDDSEAPAITGSPTVEPTAESGDAPTTRDLAETAGDAATDPVPGAPLPTAGRALATTAGVTVTTSDIRAAVDDTLTAAQRHGATVYAADVNIGVTRDDGTVDGSGYFVVKVPPEDLDGLITDLGATVGRVSGRTQETTDVTDQLVDLDIRIAVERDVIARFRNLLDDANEFQDIVDIERVISERTIALEQLLASQRNLENRVERSTLTIELQYEATPLDEPVAEDDSIDGIGDAWRTGWDVFVGALFAIGFVLAVAAPFVAVFLLMAGAVWFTVRRQRRDRWRDLASPSTSSDDSDVRSSEQLAEPSRRR